MNSIMAITLASVALLGSAGCKKRPQSPPMPLKERIVGLWELRCHTRNPMTTTCPGKHDTVLRKHLKADGTIVLLGKAPWTGKWTLQGDQLQFEFAGGGLRIRHRYRVRMVGEKLVLWSAKRNVGEVYLRPGAPQEPPRNVLRQAGVVNKTILGVSYRMRLPAGYYLAYTAKHHHRWDFQRPRQGVRYRISVTPRARRIDAGKERLEPCPPEKRPLGLSRFSEDFKVSGQDKPVSRPTGVGTYICVTQTPYALQCHADHPRGHLKPAEMAIAAKHCRSLSLAR